MYGFSERNIQEMNDIFSSIPNITEVVLFGSRAKGNNRQASDVDITLKGENLTRRDLLELDDKLHYSYLPFFFDTSIFNEITNKELIADIDKDGVTIYRKEC